MTRQRMVFASIAVGSALALAAFLVALRASQPAGIAQHPADYRTASAITDQALDLNTPDDRRRFALWRAAHELSVHLAPLRQSPHASFVRAGLFHWYELPEADRAAVLREIEPLLRDADFFRHTYRPLFELTGDLALLRRGNPGTIDALSDLLDLAAANGRFDDYRALRSELQRKRLAELEERRAEMTADELAHAIPLGIDRADEPLVAHILEVMRTRPLEADPHIPGTFDEVVDYALRRGVGPLDGLAIISRSPGGATDATRARLALAIGAADLAAQIEAAYPETRGEAWSAYHRERAEWERRHGYVAAAAAQEARALAARSDDGWQGLCGQDLCGRAWHNVDGPRNVALRITTTQSDEVPPYVEIYLDDVRVAEGPIDRERTFDLAVVDGSHRLEVRLVNPRTRNRMSRLAKLEM